MTLVMERGGRSRASLESTVAVRVYLQAKAHISKAERCVGSMHDLRDRIGVVADIIQRIDGHASESTCPVELYTIPVSKQNVRIKS